MINENLMNTDLSDADLGRSQSNCHLHQNNSPMSPTSFNNSPKTNAERVKIYDRNLIFINENGEDIDEMRL